MKKYRFSAEFIHEFFKEKNTIIRKSDGYRWHIQLNFWSIAIKDGRGFEGLTDENLAKFFDENNNFRYDEYDLVYIDYFAEFQKEELRKNGAKWFNDLTRNNKWNGTSEHWLRKVLD